MHGRWEVQSSLDYADSRKHHGAVKAANLTERERAT
jgi:hypothetical protein